MSRRPSTLPTGSQPSATDSHDAVPVVRSQPEHEVELDPASNQVANNDLGGGSPRTPPLNFVSLLNQIQGSPKRQARVLRQMQRSYGNGFVGRTLQNRLAVSQPGDAAEKEADRVAEQAASPTAGDKPPVTPSRNLVNDQSSGQRDENSENSAAPPDLESRLESEKDGGAALPERTRAQMESRLGADFTDVKIHTGGEAGRMNRDLSAQAFTQGSDIYFGEGKFQPETREGQRLLAHELTHVVQQSATVQPQLIQRDPEKPEQKPSKDRSSEVPGLLADPFWAIDGEVFKVLNSLKMTHLLNTLKSLLAEGHVNRLLQSLPMARGIDVGRLQVALMAVIARAAKTSPAAFALANRTQLEQVNRDQRLDVLRYLGPIPEQPLGEVVEINDVEYVIVDDEVRYGAEGDSTKTWRTNNPGALTVPPALAPSEKEKQNKEAIEGRLKDRAYRDDTNKYGYKYDESEGGAKLAVFETEALGKQALREKLEAFQKGGFTLKGFGSSQLGSAAAGAGYAELMVTLLRQTKDRSRTPPTFPYLSVTIDTRMSKIGLEDLVNVTQAREGWNPKGKGVSVPWSDAEELAKLPLAVRFRVMLAQWGRERKN
jgi:hypothetical protein